MTGTRMQMQSKHSVCGTSSDTLAGQLALLVAPASCNGRCTEGANSQPNENELLAPNALQACVWPHCHDKC